MCQDRDVNATDDDDGGGGGGGGDDDDDDDDMHTMVLAKKPDFEDCLLSVITLLPYGLNQ